MINSKYLINTFSEVVFEVEFSEHLGNEANGQAFSNHLTYKGAMALNSLIE